jgi:hypothetical protein
MSADLKARSGVPLSGLTLTLIVVEGKFGKCRRRKADETVNQELGAG